MNNEKIKVLLVEDVKIAQMMAKLLLEQMNCDVDTAESGKQALDLTDQNTYHFIFMDIGLPDMDGIDVAKNIKQGKNKNKTTLIVALTANIDKSIKERCLDDGISIILPKPLTKEECLQLFDGFYEGFK